MKVWVFLVLYVICTFGCRVGADERPTITTKVGVINGETTTVEFMNQKFAVNRFLGIRYGKAPKGDLRFKAPVPYEYTQPLEAISHGSACPQLDQLKIGLNSTEEDCLFLDIMVPTQEPDESSGHAVMVFIHGGGFTIGAGNMVHGEILASVGNVIVVTINYRLGLFGFLNTGDGKLPGNVGLWDQRLALQWINTNIGSFGGDISRVTIFGESAGSMSVFIQGMYPPNRGLFQNIIAESGAPSLPMGIVKDNVQALTDLAEMLGCSLDTLDSKFACIQSTDTASIIKAIEDGLTENPLKTIHFFPTIDGEMIKRGPLATVMENTEDKPFEEIEFLRSIRVINGINGAEGAMWLMLMAGEEDLEEMVISREDLRDKFITQTLPLILSDPIEDVLIDLVAAEYSDWTDVSNARLQFVKFQGDTFFNVPGYEFSLIHSNSSDSRSWLYSFEAKIDNGLLKKPSWIETANHADELGAVFGYYFDYSLMNISDYTPPVWELELSQRVMTYWTNFAKNGNPNGLNAEVETWPEFTTESQTHMCFNKEDSVGQYLYAKEHNFWRKIVPSIQDAIRHSSDSPFTSKKTDTCDADGVCD